MAYLFVTKDAIREFIQQLGHVYQGPGRIYLIGETTQVLEGWRERADELTFSVEISPDYRTRFDQALSQVIGALEMPVCLENPADLIPLPAGFEERARMVSSDKLLSVPGGNRSLEVYHYDPYSVSYRYIARGDEPDYHIVLYYLRHGWVTIEEIERQLSELLDQFSFETISQDPAEFRRKYKGLTQMWKAIQPGQTHRPTPA